jgi:hypothetical protein
MASPSRDRPGAGFVARSTGYSTETDTTQAAGRFPSEA